MNQFANCGNTDIGYCRNQRCVNVCIFLLLIPDNAVSPRKAPDPRLSGSQVDALLKECLQRNRTGIEEVNLKLTSVSCLEPNIARSIFVFSDCPVFSACILNCLSCQT